MTTSDFDTCPTGSRRKLTEQDMQIEKLSRERRMFMHRLNWTEDDVARHLDAYEKAVDELRLAS